MPLSRTQISLSEDDRRVLDAVGRRTGRSMSALIREAIQATYGASPREDRLQAALDATFGVTEATESGEELTDRIRSGRRLAELSRRS